MVVRIRGTAYHNYYFIGAGRLIGAKIWDGNLSTASKQRVNIRDKQIHNLNKENSNNPLHIIIAVVYIFIS